MLKYRIIDLFLYLTIIITLPHILCSLFRVFTRFYVFPLQYSNFTYKLKSWHFIELKIHGKYIIIDA
jgi:hypothetical protein